VSFNVSGTIRGAFNVDSVSDQSGGGYLINFTSAISSGVNSVVVSMNASNTAYSNQMKMSTGRMTSTTQAYIQVYNTDNESNDTADFSQVVVFGD